MQHECKSYISVNRNCYGAINSLKPKLVGNSQEVKAMRNVYDYQISAQLYFMNLWLQDVLAPFVHVSLKNQSQRAFPWKICKDKNDILAHLTNLLSAIQQNNTTLIPNNVKSQCPQSISFSVNFDTLTSNDKEIEIRFNEKSKVHLKLSVIKYSSKNYCPHCSSSYGFMVQCFNCDQWVHPGILCEKDRRSPETLKKKNVQYICQSCRKS